VYGSAFMLLRRLLANHSIAYLLSAVKGGQALGTQLFQSQEAQSRRRAWARHGGFHFRIALNDLGRAKAVQGQGLLQGKDVFGAIVAGQRFDDLLLRVRAAMIAVRSQFVRVTLDSHDLRRSWATRNDRLSSHPFPFMCSS